MNKTNEQNFDNADQIIEHFDGQIEGAEIKFQQKLEDIYSNHQRTLDDIREAKRATLDRFQKSWIELEEKTPTEEEYIDVQYLNGAEEFSIRPHTVNLMEVEFWRESQNGNE